MTDIYRLLQKRYCHGSWVGYDFQLLSSMTFEDEYDVPLDGVITDKREVFIDE
ncbi:MAG: hypothetical protein ACLRI8_02170 [Agathobacter rectalis]